MTLQITISKKGTVDSFNEKNKWSIATEIPKKENKYENKNFFAACSASHDFRRNYYFMR